MQNIKEQCVMSEQQDEINIVNYNGFTFTPTVLQVLPVLYVLCANVEFVIIVSSLDNNALVLLVVFFFFIFSIQTIFWYITTKIDPTDSIQMQHRNAIENKYLKS
jgi:hypothetical protein